jgi:hypothetical protein
MTDQEAANVAASVLHLLTQRGKDAREWERQSKQWEGVAVERRRELEETRASLTTLRTLARAVCDSAARDDNNVTPDTAAALRELEKAVRDV